MVCVNPYGTYSEHLIVQFDSDDDVCEKSSSTATADETEVHSLHQQTGSLNYSIDRTDLIPAAKCLNLISQHESAPLSKI